MYNLSELYIFISAAFLLAFSPGPAVVYIVTQTTTIGRRAGFWSALGVGLGDFVQVLVVSFGLASILQTSDQAVLILKFFGFFYLCFLALKALWQKNSKLEKLTTENKNIGKLFWEGFWVQVLNPKTALFFVAFLPQFTDPSRGSLGLQIVFLGSIFVMSCFVSDCLYIFFSSSIKKRLFSKKTSGGFVRYFRAAVYFVLGLLVLVEN